jgi:hypothetical protein
MMSILVSWDFQLFANLLLQTCGFATLPSSSTNYHAKHCNFVFHAILDILNLSFFFSYIWPRAKTFLPLISCKGCLLDVLCIRSGCSGLLWWYRRTTALGGSMAASMASGFVASAPVKYWIYHHYGSTIGRQFKDADKKLVKHFTLPFCRLLHQYH